MSELLLLTLIAPPTLEEPLVDWLLQCESEIGFSTFPINGHFSRPDGLSLAEQVTCRKNQIRFEIHVPGAEWPSLLERLHRDFAGTGIHYWVAPVVAQGRV